MSSDGLFSAFAAVANVIFVLIAAYIYSSLIRQISARSTTIEATQRNFGLADAIVAILLSGLFLSNIALSFSTARDVTSPRIRDLMAGALLTIGILVFLIAFL